MEKVTRMNCERVRQLWDEYRDGQLSGPEARGLEEHLADCRSCEKLWRAESGWLAVLSENAPVSTDVEARAFSAAVVRRWSRQDRPSIVGRIVRFSAAAAVVAAMLSIPAVVVERNQTPVAAGSGETQSLAVAPSASDAFLVGQINGPVVAVRDAFDSTSQWLDVNRYVDGLVELIDTAAPPPQNIRMQ